MTEKPNFEYFKDIEMSEKTKKGLDMANFVKCTEIQKQSLPFSLAGSDVLGAAKTGSGKTLAFLIPVLEKLESQNWSSFDGLGALIISPTRELALQIFKVLRDIGKRHLFSAGLLIGGKDLKQEQVRVGRMNILVATPGRLLQHMDQSPEFNCDNLQILVLDEADRILDAGFSNCLNAILENLPKDRQTLLFSATQTKAVKDLARLSVKNAEYVAVHREAKVSTPKNLKQHYIVCQLFQKLDILFSFIKTHLKQKTIIFLSSGKQVRFAFEAFCKMQPGIPLLCLHGKINQEKRISIFEQFSRKTQGCLFATDVAARGLDIPAVDWVFQVDCPEDADTYIHRVGRTARYEAEGQALILLLPTEKDGMLKALEAKKVPIQEIKVNPAKTVSIKGQLMAICSEYPNLKYLAQKCFITYMRSIYLHGNKDIFDVHALPAEAYAESLGLLGAPNIKFRKSNKDKNKSFQLESLDNRPFKLPQEKKNLIQNNNSASSSDNDEQEKTKKAKTRMDKMFTQKNSTILSSHFAKIKDNEGAESGQDDDLITLARRDHDVSGESGSEVNDDLLNKKKNPNKKIKSKTKRRLETLGHGQRLVFDQDGQTRDPFTLETVQQFAPTKESLMVKKSQFLEKSTAIMKEADTVDKDVAKNRRRQARHLKRIKEKESRREEENGHVGVTLCQDFVQDGGGADENELPRYKKLKTKDLEKVALGFL